MTKQKSAMTNYGFELTSETDSKLVYSRDGFQITYKLEQGICIEMCIEIVE